MMDSRPPPADQPKAAGRARLVLATLCGVLALGYAAGIVLGTIPEHQRLDATALIGLALAVMTAVLLAFPGALPGIKSFEMQGFKLEMLEKVKDRQAEQAERLDDIALMLPLLFPERERKHLLNLAAGRTEGYRGSHSVRVELRRLRSIGLLRKLPSRHIGDLKDGTVLDLATLVELTPLGAQWARRLKELDATEKSDVETSSTQVD
jgi:hypothetical protein